MLLNNKLRMKEKETNFKFYTIIKLDANYGGDALRLAGWLENFGTDCKIRNL